MLKNLFRKQNHVTIFCDSENLMVYNQNKVHEYNISELVYAMFMYFTYS